MALVKVKDPDAVLNYTFDWDDEYLAAGVTISTSTWTVTPAGLTIDSESETTTTTTVALSGGTAGQVYTVTNKITTTSSETEERSLIVRVEQR